VRRRKWLLRNAVADQQAGNRVAWLTTELMDEAETQKTREASAALGAARAFIGLFSELLKRSNLWTVRLPRIPRRLCLSNQTAPPSQMLPWDPFSYSVVYQRHNSYLARVRELLLPGRLMSSADVAAFSAGGDLQPPPAAEGGAVATTSAQKATPASAPVTLDDALLDDLQVRVIARLAATPPQDVTC